MDQRERTDDHTEAFRAALDGRQTTLWTAMPGIVESFNAAEMTAVVQPAIQGRMATQAGGISFVNMPQCLDVPVVFPGGGGVSLTFPVQPGDECLLIFAARCIDAWWQSGGVQPQAEARMHDLSDGFALVGVRSQPRVISGISTTSAQLRTDDGSALLDINAQTKAITLTAPGGVVMNANLQVKGNLAVSGETSLGQATQPVELANGKPATTVLAS